jgi:hypothetical protein
MLLQPLPACHLGRLLQSVSAKSLSGAPIMSPSSDKIHRGVGVIDLGGVMHLSGCDSGSDPRRREFAKLPSSIDGYPGGSPPVRMEGDPTIGIHYHVKGGLERHPNWLNRGDSRIAAILIQADRRIEAGRLVEGSIARS